MYNHKARSSAIKTAKCTFSYNWHHRFLKVCLQMTNLEPDHDCQLFCSDKEPCSVQRGLHIKAMDLTLNMSLHWHHNGCNAVSNHQPHNCLLNHLFMHRSKFPFDDVIMFRPEPKGQHFMDNIFECISLNEKLSIPNKFSLKCVSMGLTDIEA